MSGVSAQAQTAHIYIQPLGASSSSAVSSPAPLAKVTYELSKTGEEGPHPFPFAEVTSYEAPELPEASSLVRIGLFDPATREWIGATSAASVENFGKGYSPHFLVNLVPARDGKEVQLLGASLKGVRIDAGQTRDFGPQVKLVVASRGKQPELNRPVVLSPEGKKLGEKEEKTFLQKFVILSPLSDFNCLLLCFPSGGVSPVIICDAVADYILSQVLVDDWNCIIACFGRRRRRWQIERYRRSKCESRRLVCTYQGPGVLLMWCLFQPPY